MGYFIFNDYFHWGINKQVKEILEDKDKSISASLKLYYPLAVRPLTKGAIYENPNEFLTMTTYETQKYTRLTFVTLKEKLGEKVCEPCFSF